MAFLHQISCGPSSKQYDCLSSVPHQKVSYNLQSEAAINLPDNTEKRCDDMKKKLFEVKEDMKEKATEIITEFKKKGKEALVLIQLVGGITSE